MIKKIVTLRCLTSPPPRRRSRVLLSPPPSATPTTTSATAFVTCGFLRFSISDCADELPCDMFEEGGRVWLCALRVCVCCSCLVSFVCFVRWRFIFLRLNDMELVLTLRVGARYYLNSKQDIWIQKSNDNLRGSARGFEFVGGGNQGPTATMCNKKNNCLLKYFDIY